MNFRYKVPAVFVLLLVFFVWSAPIRAEDGVSEAVRTARGCGVPDEFLTGLTALAIEKQVQPAEVIAFLDLISTAGREKFPVAPFVDKIEEGLAKHVPPPRIQAVLAQKLDNYRFARRALGDLAGPKTDDKTLRPESISELAEVFDLGISRDDALEFMVKHKTAPPEMTILALENLAVLRQAGFADEQTMLILNAGLDRRMFTPEWRRLSEIMVRANRNGTPEDEIGRTVLEVIEEDGDMTRLTAALGLTGRNLREGPETGSPPSGESVK